jgi:hypothetical protein
MPCIAVNYATIIPLCSRSCGYFSPMRDKQASTAAPPGGRRVTPGP